MYVLVNFYPLGDPSMKICLSLSHKNGVLSSYEDGQGGNKAYACRWRSRNSSRDPESCGILPAGGKVARAVETTEVDIGACAAECVNLCIGGR